MSSILDSRKIAQFCFLIVVVGFVLGPLTATFLGGFKTNADLRTSPFGLPEAWHFEYYLSIISQKQFWTYIANSLFVACSTVFLTLIVGGMAAYVFAQVKFFGSGFLLSYILMGLMFPFAAAILPLFIKIRDIGLLDSYWGVILPQTAYGLAFSIMLLKTFFEQLPKELFEAAYVDGCGYVRFFFKFTLPLSLPILATVSVFVFVNSWNNYLLPLIVFNDRSFYTWPLGMMQFRGQYIVEWNQILAFVTLTITPAVVFFLAAQKYIVSGLTGGAVKG